MEHDRFALQDEDVVRRAHATFARKRSVDFSDCLVVEIARKAGHVPIGTFDRNMSRVDGAHWLCLAPLGHVPVGPDREPMFDTADQILNQIRAGEDGRAEFKEVRLGDRGVISPNTEDLAAELVAFANAVGGAVLFGADDSGAVAGIPPARLDAVEGWIINVATHNCEPPIRPILRKVLLPSAAGDERHVLLAEVPRGLYVHRTSGGRYYLRVGSTKRDLTPPELARLFQQRGREYVFDEQAVLAAAVAFVAQFMQPPTHASPSGADARYDLDVVDEAVVNAVARRDYAISGSKIRLFLFADRIELYSPGGLPSTITLDEMPYRTFTRNQLLVSFLSRIRSKRTGQVFLESRGEGVRKILREGEAHSGRRPEYRLFGDELRLTLWAKSRPVD